MIANHNGIGSLSIMKQDQKDFKFTALRKEVKKANQIKELYLYCREFIPTLEISGNCIQYYCELTEQFDVFRTRKLSKWQKHLHCLCFIYYRYQQFMDNLIVSYQFHVHEILNGARRHIKIKRAEHGASLSASWPKVSKILRLIPSDTISPETQYREFQQRAFSILPQSEYEKLADFMDGTAFDREKERWSFFSESSRSIALYLRPILLCVNFEYHAENKILPKLISLLKGHLGKNKPISEFLTTNEDLDIPEDIVQYMLKTDADRDGKQYIDPAKLEFYIYRRMFYALDHGTLYCNDSVSFRNLEIDLVSDETLGRAEEIASEFGYPKIPVYCRERLDKLEQELHESWMITNKNIIDGINNGIVIEEKDSKKVWHLTYEAKEKPEEDSFFKNLAQIEIASIIQYVAEKINLWSAFIHIKPKYSKQKPNNLAVQAGFLSDAFGFGIKRMSQMCDIDYNVLDSNHANFIRIETLKKGSSLAANYFYNLQLFEAYNIEENKVYGDIDGQRFETKRSTIKSRNSLKYFGMNKGVSIQSMIVNNIPVNSHAIGSEHESHFLFDLVKGNQTDIPVHKITGDNHTVNKLNFLALDAIDVQFMPAFNVKAQSEKLYCTRNIDLYNGLISPKSKVNLNLIRREERNIIKVLLSLILQDNTQSTIIRKLSSHKRYSRLKSALWEYDKIFSTIHTLNLINNQTLRQNIKTSRNRAEAYHQQQRMIRKIYDGMLKGKKIVENELQTQATRLVANCVIVYNAILINSLYLMLIDRHGKDKARKIISRISPIAWSHIIFTGKYSFKSSTKNIDMQGIINQIEKIYSNSLELQ